MRVAKVHAAPDTDVVLDEAWLTTDAAGHRRVIMTGPLSVGQRERFFWLVDTGTNQYRVLRLTDDHGHDAKRIQELYRRFGFDTSEQDIADGLLLHRNSQEDRIRELKGSVGQGADDVEALFFQPGDCSTGVDEGGPRVDGEGQWVLRCQGYGYADVQTWEPARYFFNVDHLNETWTGAWWTHVEPSGSFSVVKDGFCWANPTTFIGTVWYTIFCQPSYASLYHGFDSSRTGQYVNIDFVSIFFPGMYVPIYITSTASVQFANGQANWGAQYYEDGWFSERWLLSGIITGEAYEYGCSWDCDPDWWIIAQCDSQTNESYYYYWSYELCACVVGGSPIIIDLDNDGLALTNATDGVTFDLTANGKPVRVAWTRRDSNDAFLVLDRNGNGTIDSGAELFGNFTPQPASKEKSSKKADPNGFLALAVFDDPSNGGNGDGQITEADAVYKRLRLWIDANHDGISQPDELKPLADYGVRSISLHYVTGQKIDEFGNLYRFRSHVIMDKDSFDHGSITRRAVDVFLTFIPTP